MRAERLATGVMLLSDCPRPVWNRAVCEEITSHGAQSLLVVDEDTTPWPSGQPGNLWCYVRPLTGHQRPASAMMAATALLNVVLNAMLIPRLGLLGAAAAGVSTVLRNLLMLVYVMRRLGMDPTIFRLPRRGA